MNTSPIQFRENSLYRYIQEYEYLIPILSASITGMLTGAKIAGKYGVVLGGIAGTTAGLTDQFLTNHKITSKHYLTSAVLGTSIASPFELPYYLGEITGFIMGLIAPSGYLQNLSPVVPTIMTTAVTTQYARDKLSYIPNHKLYGALAGVTISLVDETMIHFNVSSNHYLSTTTSVTAAFDFMSPKLNNIINWATSFSESTQTLHHSVIKLTNNIPHFSFAIGTMLGAYTANKTDFNPLDWKPISLGKDLLNTYERVVDRKELDPTIELFTITTATTQILSYYAIFLESESLQIISPLYAELGDSARLARVWSPLKLELLKYLSLIIPTMIVTYSINSFFNDYFSRKISYLIEDSINSEWLTKNTALKLSNSDSTLTLIHHKTDDVHKLADHGSSLMGVAFFKLIGGIISIGFMANNKAMDTFYYSILYNEITSEVSKTISERINEYADPIRDLVAARDNIEKDITNKIEVITERGGIHYHQVKLNDITNNLRNLNEQKKIWEKIHSSWLQLKHFSNHIFNYLTTAFKIYEHTLEFNVRYKVLDTLGKIFELISFETDNKANILEVEKALESVNKLIDGMRNDTTKIKQHNKEYQQGDLSITFENFSIFLQEGEKKLIDIEYLQFTEGNFYAIGGPKGSGKSSFTSTIIDLGYNGIYAEGTIIFSTPNGNPPVIISVPQTNHLPLNSSLFELFYYPQILPKDPSLLENISEQIQQLWEKIVPQDNSTTISFSLMDELNAVKDWSNILSGGEKKIVFLISALIQNPDVLILDETFTGLDPHTNQRAQFVTKEYSNGITIAIDHNHLVDDNNVYTVHLNLTNYSFEVIDIH